jgi:flavodoxin
LTSVQSSVSNRIKAAVIFGTRYGNTEKIARSLETGLKGSGFDTVCVDERNAAIDSLEQYDLICFGAPTEGFSAPKSMKEFLERVKTNGLSRKYGFAFDTKLDWRVSGSAAKFIEKELTELGLQIVAPRESAIVYTLKEGGTIVGARLKEGEADRFEKIGAQIGTVLAAVRESNNPGSSAMTGSQSRPEEANPN